MISRKTDMNDDRLGDVIDNGIVPKYKCEKCGRCTELETYIGVPAVNYAA